MGKKSSTLRVCLAGDELSSIKPVKFFLGEDIMFRKLIKFLIFLFVVGLMLEKSYARDRYPAPHRQWKLMGVEKVK